MKALILGSNGFIGHHLVNFYLKKNYEVYGCDLVEVSNKSYQYFKTSLLSNDIDLLFNGIEYDICINASGSGNVGYSIAQPLSDFESNVSAVSNVLNAIQKFSPACKYVHISSAAVYGNPKTLPIKETDETNPLSPYGWHKLMSETLCKEYNSVYNLQTAIIRPFSVYGPGLRKQLFWDIFQKTLNNGNSLEMWGTGRESRDFIYIDDLIQVIDLVIENGDFNASIYNAASGIESTIFNVTELLLKYSNKNIDVLYNQHKKAGDPLNWCADISKIRSLGYSHQYEIDNGIEILAKWLDTQN